MVDVTRHNFEEFLPEISARIQESAFVAVDTEFTGLHIDGSTGNSLFDTPEARYQKLKQLTTQYTICQIGLCAFVNNPKKNSYESYTYNFYLFPRSCSDVDARFLCQASCMEFLVHHKFNFNKLFYDGISYINNAQEKQLREQPVVELARDADEDALKQSHSEIAEWLPSSIEGDTLRLKTIVTDEFESLRIHTMLRDYSDNIWTVSSSSGQIIVTRVSEESRKQFENASKDRILDYLLGFSKIFRLLGEYKKPLLGHNMLTDLLFMYEKFHQPLPDRLSEFKKTIHELFPQIIDTKHLSFILKKEFVEKGLPLTNTGLDQLYQQLDSKKGRFLALHSPIISIAQENSKYRDDHHLHEAGYDAYLCGYVFIRMAHYLAAKQIGAVHTTSLDFSQQLFAVKSHVNKLNIIRATVPYINFAGSDPPSRRPKLLHVSAVGPTSKLSASQLASTFGVYSSVDVQLLDNRNALLAVSTYGGCKDILRTFKRHEKLRVNYYNMFQHSKPVRYTLWGAIAVMGVACVWTLVGDRVQGR